MTKLVTLFTVLTVSGAAFASGNLENPKLRQCAVDLCGPADDYLPTLARGAFETIKPQDVNAFLREKVDPAVNRLIETSIRVLRLRTSSIASLIEKSKSEELSTDQKTFLTALVLLTQADSVLEHVVESPDGRTYSINAQKLKAKRPDLDDRMVEGTTRVLNAFFSTDGFRNSNNISGVAFDDFIQSSTKAYGVDFTPADVKYTLMRFNAQANSIIARIGFFVFDGFDLSLLGADKDPELFTKAEKARVMSAISRIYMYQAALDPAVSAEAIKYEIKLEKALEILNWRKTVETIDTILSSPALLKSEKEKALGLCRTNITQAIASAPSPLRLEKAMELMERVKLASKAAARSYFTGAALEAAQSAIDRAKFRTPTTSTEIKSQIETTISHHVLESFSRVKNIERAAAGGPGWFSFLALSFARDNDSMMKTLFEDVEKACSRLKPSPFEDLTLARIDRVQMSWQTSLFPEIGAGIVAHELGHIVSHSIQIQVAGRTEYDNAKSCSGETHSVLRSINDLAGHPSQFGEEDWADAFAVTTLKELRSSWPYVKNYSCALLGIKENQAEFDSLRISSPTGSSVHSEPLLRALQTQVGLGKKIPRSCGEAFGPKVETLLSTKICSK